MISPEADKIHKKSIIVEGHRDVFEMIRLSNQGQKFPLLNVTLPRLKRANISTTFYAICGDSVTHVKGTYRFLHSALENIDMLRQEVEASHGKMRIVLDREDLPTAPSPDVLDIVMSFEGGRPLEGRIENLRNFYCLGLHADHLEFA
jgi:microsomal dipeptidase-like Zn-dependent dipeptidase